MRQVSGFGFRIIGGREEGSQVNILHTKYKITILYPLPYLVYIWSGWIKYPLSYKFSVTVLLVLILSNFNTYCYCSSLVYLHNNYLVSNAVLMMIIQMFELTNYYYKGCKIK